MHGADGRLEGRLRCLLRRSGLGFEAIAGHVSWTPPGNDAGIMIYETYLAAEPAGSGRVLVGRLAVGTNVYAVLSDTASAAQSHIVAYTKSRLADRTTPMALALTDFFEERLRCFLRRSGLGRELRGWRRVLDSAGD